MKRKKGKSRHWTPKKKSKTEKTTTEDGSSSAVAELPLDVWGDIFSWLPFKQVLVCRCICRAWNALLARIHHHPNPTTPAAFLCYRGPWTRPLGNYLTLAELRNGASYATRVARMEDCYNHVAGVRHTSDDFLRPVISCHGLVCFASFSCSPNHMNIFVGNPLLKEDLLLVRPPEINIKTEECQWKHLAGFGFSPGADRYKILMRFNVEEEQSHFLICTVGEGSRSSRDKHQVCLPSWRRLLRFPFHFRQHSCPLGSHLNAGIHWLASDSHKDNSFFVSRLDLDTEQFGRVEAPQSPDFNGTPFRDRSLGVSDGHLIICANLRRQGIVDIWVMNQFNLWTKNLVVRSPIPTTWMERVEVLNYGKVEAASREGAVAEVMLLVGSFYLYACTTRGRHMRQLDFPPSRDIPIVHIPSLLSIKDVAQL